MRKKTLQLEGQQFGTVRVTGRGSKPSYWKCACAVCGNKFEARGTRVHSGEARCVCQQKRTKHGHTAGRKRSRTYKAWENMLGRVDHDPDYTHVNVDPEWRSFKCFVDEVSECPEGHSPDRINPYGDYFKGNFRWVPLAEQSENKRNSRLLHSWMRPGYHGAVMSLPAWARFLRKKTNNPLWTAKRLTEVLKVMELDDVLYAVEDVFNPNPAEFALKVVNGFGPGLKRILVPLRDEVPQEGLTLRKRPDLPS